MKIPAHNKLASVFFGNFFCLIPNTNLAFVAISKNAVTFLKKVAYYSYKNEWIQEFDRIHNTIGYAKDSPFLVEVAKMNEYEAQHGTRIKFAVWRDPVERIESTYKLFCLEREYREYFHFLGLHQDNSFSQFFNFLQYEWSKRDPLHQDEHIRKQSHYYSPHEVDYIIPISLTRSFLTRYNVPFVDEKSNETSIEFKLTDTRVLNLIRRQYKDDYQIKCNYS